MCVVINSVLQREQIAEVDSELQVSSPVSSVFFYTHFLFLLVTWLLLA